MKRIGKKVAILLAVMALTGGYVHTASMTAQVTAASPEELQKSAWEKLLANNAGALTEEEKNSLNQVFNNISAWDQYIRLYSTYTQVIGGDNHAVDSNSIQGRAVYGGNHQYTRDAAATLGQQGNNFGTNSVVVGYQPSAFGENSIAMGTGATTFPIKYGENFAGYANAIGADAWSGDMGNAFGAGAVAMGQGSVAIGTMAVAGSPDIQKYISRNKYEYQPYFEQLQKAYPNIFGETQPNESVTERSERMGQQIFAEYSSYFKKIGIPDFATFKTRVSQWESVLQKLGWHMALSKDARHHVTALGFGATATATGGVALGAFSEADRGTVTEKAPFSEFELTNQNTLGAVSVGNKTFLRQLINVADGTEATDAVNLRQLQGLETKLKDASGSVHYFSVNPDNNKRTKPAKGSDNSKNDGAYGENSVAIGAFAEAADKNTLALGWSVKALGQDSLALGTMVYSYGLNSNAVGNQAAALGEESSAFGNQAKAMDMGTTALGNNAMAIQNGSTAVGYQSLSAVSSTSMGTNSYALGQASLALGQRSYIGDTTFRDTYTKYNEEKGNDNNIPGYYISDLIKKNDPKIAKYKEQFKNQLQGLDGHNQEAVLRYLIIADLNKSVQFATAVGNHSTVGASQGTALGFYSTVTGAYGTALGYNSIATAYGAMASGAYAKANTVGSVAIGFQSKVNNYGGVAIGSEATVGKNGGVALGNKSTADRGSGAVGYVFGADNSTLTKALEAPGNKARFDELKMKIKDEDVSAYNALVMTFKNAAKDSPEKEKAKQEIEKWKAAHPDFLKNVKARKAFENAWQSTYEAVSVGDVEKGITRQITGVAAGSEDTDAVNVAQLKAANSKIENNIKSITNLTTKVEKGGIKYFSVNPKTENLPTANISSDNSANDGATGMETMAIGKGARAAGQQSIVIGQDAVSEHHGGSIVIGQNAKASGDREWHGVVVGSRAEVTGGSGVALGNDSKVTASGGIALGFGSLADREWNVLGYTPDRNANSLQDRLAGTEYDELVKKLAPLITEHNQLVDDFNHENNPIKKKEKHEKYEAWKAAHPDYDADVKKRDMLKSAWKSGSGAVSVGNSALKATRQIIGVAAGSEDTDAVNVAQLKALNKKVDTNTETINNLNLKVGKGGVHYFSVKADDSGRPAGTNYDNDGATGDFAIAAGYSSVAAGTSSIAVGAQAKSPGNWGVAVGYKASANNISDIAMGINAESSGSWGVAIGGNSQAKGASGIALGQQARAESQSGIAIGVQSEATGIWGIAIGQNAKAQASTSVAIACRAEAQNENSVAIGNFAKAIGATSTVIGAQATASGTWGTSVGFFAEANSENGTAIGVNSKARAKKGIALGAYSVADREGRRIGYSLGGDNSTIDNVLESVGLTEKYNQLESVVNPLKDEYKSLVGAFQKAAGGSAEKAAAKEKLDKWKMEHPDFMSAITEMKKILTAWKSNSGALSIGNEEYGITRQITGVAAGSEDTDAVNVAQLKALAMLPMNMYFGGKVENNIYTPGKENWRMPLNEFRMDFGDGLKATQVEKDGKKYTLITLDKESLKGDPAFKGDKGESGQAGKDGEKGKDGVNGTNGTDGKNGTNGKSAYEIWRDHEENGTQPNKDKSEQEFLDSLKGKDGKDGTGADIDIQGNDTGIVVVDKKTDTAGKTKYTLGLGTKIKAGEVTIDGTKDKENVVVGDVKINGEKGHGTVTGLSNTTWDEKHVVSGRAATEDQLQAVSQKNRQAISELGTQLERGTASAAALAALHPQEFDPADKWDFAVGYSNYRSANTFAFGGFYRPNERTLVSLGGTFGGENIVNVGLSFKTGKGSDGISTSRVAMAREIQALKEKDAAKDRIMQELLQVQKKKEAEIQALKEKDGQREEQIRHLTAMVMELKK
ncbi:YadA-like family protein [Megasphaera sp. UPII 135-E]|uniref:YadA-like family protein n=1 Tax=Megasphaera sp. UPII 135-E TaxID=1000569 RepID=UPI00021A291C|nr:YadA-like family protein [Megasphaera sp. UPII 135-E]EGS31761.1 Hep/Hag repeat protein [Megasphaera sp. UPII 135-E]